MGRIEERLRKGAMLWIFENPIWKPSYKLCTQRETDTERHGGGEKEGKKEGELVLLELSYKRNYVSPRSHGLSNKKQESGVGYLPSKHWSEVSLRSHPQTVQALTTALGCLPELDGKNLLLKTPHSLVTRL